MLDAAKRSGKKLSIGYQNRFRDDSLYLKKEAEDGTFGDIYYAKATAIRRRGVPNWGVFLDEYDALDDEQLQAEVLPGNGLPQTEQR